MLRFFRTIRHRLLTENRVSKYLLYAVGEILLVVIGILLALQVDNWNETQKEIASLVSTLNRAKGHIQTEIILGEHESESLSKWIRELDSAVSIIIHEDELSKENQRILERMFPDLPKIGLMTYNTDILNNLAGNISDAKIDSDLTTEISQLVQDIEVLKWLADKYFVTNMLDLRNAIDPKVLSTTWDGDAVYDFKLLKTDKTLRRYIQHSRLSKQNTLNRNNKIIEKFKALNKRVERLINELEH